MVDDQPIVLSKSAILKGLEAYTYQFDGYSDHAKGWAKEGYNLFIRGAQGYFDPDCEEEKDDEDDRNYR
jgi:hypothetical protein